MQQAENWADGLGEQSHSFCKARETNAEAMQHISVQHA